MRYSYSRGGHNQAFNRHFLSSFLLPVTCPSKIIIENLYTISEEEGPCSDAEQGPLTPVEDLLWQNN